MKRAYPASGAHADHHLFFHAITASWHVLHGAWYMMQMCFAWATRAYAGWSERSTTVHPLPVKLVSCPACCASILRRPAHLQAAQNMLTCFAGYIAQGSFSAMHFCLRFIPLRTGHATSTLYFEAASTTCQKSTLEKKPRSEKGPTMHITVLQDTGDRQRKSRPGAAGAGAAAVHAAGLQLGRAAAGPRSYNRSCRHAGAQLLPDAPGLPPQLPRAAWLAGWSFPRRSLAAPCCCSWLVASSQLEKASELLLRYPVRLSKAYLTVQYGLYRLLSLLTPRSSHQQPPGCTCKLIASAAAAHLRLVPAVHAEADGSHAAQQNAAGHGPERLRPWPAGRQAHRRCVCSFLQLSPSIV